MKKFDARAAIKGRKLKHDPAKYLDGFDPFPHLRKRRRQLVCALEDEPHLPSRYLANTLSNCGKRINGKREHCNSAACPVCMRAARQWFTDEVSTIAKQHKRKSGNSGVSVTIILSGLRASIGELREIAIASVRRRASRAFTKLNLDLPVVGGIDVSFNEEAGSKNPGHYQVHLAVYIVGHPASKRARRRLNQQISGRLRLEPSAHVRVQVKPFRDPIKQGSYLLKSRFDKRLSLIKKNGKRGTKKFNLKPKQVAEIGLWLGELQPLDRVLLHGVQLKNGRLVIITVNPTKKKCRP